MKVGNINPVLFKNTQPVTNPDKDIKNDIQIKELSSITPDYNVKTPQKYTSFGIQQTENGLKIYSYKLGNGHRVTIIPMEDSPAVVKNYVNVGSMNETDDIKGISHFLEHMAFNGTNGDNGHIKLNQGDSFKKIDKLGGWTNASTNYAITDYVNSTPLLEETDLEKQLQIIAAMAEDLTLAENMIEKEKGPVCSEINMILDNPQTIVMDQTVRSLFNIKSSADELVGGSVKHIQNLDRDKVKAYYDKYYNPGNMNLVVTGNVNPQKTIEMISKIFNSSKTGQGKVFEGKITPLKQTVRKDFITDKASSTEVMLGFSGPKNNDTKSKIIFEIAAMYLESAKTNISKELKRLNTDADFGIEKISTNPENPMLIYYTLNCADDKSEEALKVIFDIVSRIKAPKQKDLENIKERLVQSRKNGMEYSLRVNDITGKAVFDGNLDYLTNYEKILNEVTADDVEKFINQYLDLNKAAVTLVHPETTEAKINENYNKASCLSFKGRPVNPEKISSQKLDNNFEVGFQETKNNNIYFDLNLYYNLPNSKPAVREVLAQIYSQNLEDEKYRNFEENNNLSIYFDLSEDNLYLGGYSGYKNFEKTAEEVRHLLNSPQITQQYLDKAVERLKDSLGRYQESAAGLYIDNEAKINPLYTSKADILKGLDSVTLEEVKALHNEILKNSRGTICINIPQENPEFKEITLKEFNKFSPVKENSPNLKNVYKPNLSPVVLTKERSVSQADIMQTYKFPLDGSIKEHAMCDILNTILSSSHTIGLFDTLREKEHLAYTVYSNIDRVGNCGELSLNILTTTDNKEIGEISYDNVQKSINGFNRQIGELLDSKYSDEDFESAKRILKAKLLQKEGVPSKLNALNRGLDSKEGIDYENKVFDVIDSITREDIDKFAQTVFQNPPIYSVIASKDTLKANHNYLESIKNSNGYFSNIKSNI